MQRGREDTFRAVPPSNLPPLGGGKGTSLVEQGSSRVLCRTREVLCQKSPKVWQGVYEGLAATWLRWYDQDANVLPTGAERAEHERQRAECLAAQLRALGIEPQDI